MFVCCLCQSELDAEREVFRKDLAYVRPVAEDDLQDGVSQFFYLPLLSLRDQLTPGNSAYTTA